jgi:hypothetical protein
MPSASLWASVPHYVAAAPNPKAALALVRLRVLTADPGLGIVRHADSGEPDALAEHYADLFLSGLQPSERTPMRAGAFETATGKEERQ